MAFIVIPYAKPFVLAITCIFPLPEITKFQPMETVKIFILKISRDLIGCCKNSTFFFGCVVSSGWFLTCSRAWLSLARLRAIVSTFVCIFFANY